MKYELNFFILSLALLSFYNIIFFFFLKNYASKYLFFLLDNPDGKRKLHQKPTLMTGGIYVASYLLIFYFYSLFFLDFKDLEKILLTSLVIFLVGIKDDQSYLSPLTKLFLITFILCVLIFNSNDLIINQLYFQTFDKKINLSELSIPITILCLLLLINAFNLCDGINGLAVGISIIWTIFLFIFSTVDLKFFLIPLIITQILIFIYIYKGHFFLGDNGTLTLSSLIGILTIFVYNNNLKTFHKVIYVEDIFILFFLPGIDMFRLFVTRIYNKKNPFFADRNHLHHLLIQVFNLNKTLILYFLIIILIFLLNFFNIIKSYILIIFLILIYFTLLYFLKKKLK